ncbi:hypothetical protein AN964_23820 [Heyndrickxia shackletonii]|uniref:Uncharacterized protein n=1 Tax=Heyndrickxia shackletonii TaxID=157838 RepID=A0A0Q3WRJ8_9BACI|nr:hypothetical protein [Heyndrickxia shackletonii]KQL50667.1 hypothetical protein AN964_23820 [Heyndrickxia shackletonii]MBB2479910.1 hypothetical protein [Bacillus sp. APMAM]NEY98005.1 hypothetical protein [Heyndrickxia shackletonii]RTZ56605.1 hypothetical protein EKO25_06530 [Bacillus sp. SAJ1]
MSIDKDELLLSAQSALIGSIPKKLRGLTVRNDYNSLLWVAYFDDQPTEKEKGILSKAFHEVASKYPSIQSTREEFVFIPTSFRIDMLDYWVFLRWEE